jgi:hypothetical protein
MSEGPALVGNWNFPFLNVIKSKMDFFKKLNTFARSKNPDTTGSGLEKL